MTDFEAVLRHLAAAHAEYIIVGGLAATAHGASRFTNDLDIVYRRTPENATRIATALGALKPYPRGAPPGLPFVWDARTIMNGLNFTLATTAGDVDVLGEITGGGGYDRLLERTETATLYGIDVHILDLPELIRVKRAAGRPKDFEAIAELELILQERMKK